MGRPRSDATSVFALRLRPATKQAIADAAARNGRPINSEIAARLEASLRHEDGHEDEHEDDDVGRLLRALGQVMTAAGEQAAEYVPGKPRWTDHSWAYMQAAAAAARLIALLQPPGAIEPPAVKPSPELIREFGGKEEAARDFIERVHNHTGINVVDYWLRFQQRILGPKLAARPKANRP
jgi:hypothetical protein